MHGQFTDWHRAAGIEPMETSPKQWEVISAYPPEPEEVISLARFFFGFTKQEDTPLDKFGTALQDADTNFSMRKDKQHLAVFAGAELISVIERNEDKQLSDLAALCLVCGAAQGVREAPPVLEMPKIAARYIDTRTGERNDKGSDSRELRIVAEETNMLWWLISEYSRDRKELWKIVGFPATSIIAGKELADLTRIIPGPVAATAFLDRIIRFSDSANSSKPVKVKDAIEKTPREWREQSVLKKLELQTGLEDLMPINNALSLSLAVTDGDEWSSVFEKGTAVSANSKMLPNALAYQVFLERLLARLPGELKKPV
jgi:hypothetical protein